LRRGGDDGSSQTGQHGAQQQEPRHDIEALFNLLATLYRDAPDAALKYWIEDDADGSPEAVHRHSRLSAFLRWAADCRVPSMTRAFFDMLGSLATGERSAGFAFEFLAQNSAAGQDGAGASGSLCSWSSLFDALTFYANQRGANGEHFGPTEIPPEEVTLLKSFLRLLRIVVSSSSVARAALYDNQRYKPVLTLFNLIVQPVPIDLKAALLEAVSAFTASPTASSVALNARNAGMASVAAEIGKRTWMTLESSQILPTIPVRDVRGNILKPQPPGGIVQELEQVESPSKVYPTTTAFVNLLVTLLGGPPAGLSSSSDPGAAADSLEYASAANARPIPDNLGAPHRSPAEGVQAYTKYVVEDVFLQAQTREYRNPGERWRLVERCLSYFERCLLSLSFDRFLSGSTPNDPNNPTSSPVYQLLLDPGFDVLVRILGGTKILEELFNLASVELEVLDNTEAATDTFVLCVLKSLRIIQRVFTLQAPFLEVVLPTLL
jgi:nuclear pore complex protein Nup205